MPRFDPPSPQGSTGPISTAQVLSLGMDWVAEFMDSFPVVVRPEHLVQFRLFVSAQMGIDKFEDAYAAFYRSVAANSWIR